MTTDRDFRRVQRRTGDKNKRHFHMGPGRGGSDRNDKNSKRQRPKQNEHKPVIFLVLTPLHPRKNSIVEQIFLE